MSTKAVGVTLAHGNGTTYKNVRSLLLTLAVPTIPTEITTTRMLQLAMTFGTSADHSGHDRAHDMTGIG